MSPGHHFIGREYLPFLANSSSTPFDLWMVKPITRHTNAKTPSAETPARRTLKAALNFCRGFKLSIVLEQSNTSRPERMVSHSCLGFTEEGTTTRANFSLCPLDYGVYNTVTVS